MDETRLWEDVDSGWKLCPNCWSGITVIDIEIRECTQCGYRFPLDVKFDEVVRKEKATK